jgi:hypothetical protein
MSLGRDGDPARLGGQFHLTTAKGFEPARDGADLGFRLGVPTAQGENLLSDDALLGLEDAKSFRARSCVLGELSLPKTASERILGTGNRIV